MNWYQMNNEEVLNELNSSINGLSTEQRKIKAESVGLNKLPEPKSDSELKKFIVQFNDVLIFVLIGAALLKGALQQYIDMVVILIVVLINGAVGYIQEKNAQSSLNGLMDMMTTKTVVMIHGAKTTIDSTELVPGDIVLLGPGDRIPADLRIIESYDLLVEEAILTGESEAVAKNNKVTLEKVDIIDRLNMVYSGTSVKSGTATGVVVETGITTELGKISQFLGEVQSTETPLIKQMKKLNHQIFFAVVVLIIFLFIFSIIFREYSLIALVIALVSLAVATVPEGLPAVLSIILSVGVQSMAKKNAIIKKLPTVETLGSVNIICSDKTGTLTKNEMTVVSVVTNGKAKAFAIDQPIASADTDRFTRLIETAVLCNDTDIKIENDKKVIIGNPTEAALLDFVARTGKQIENNRLDKIPFDSAYKYMATLNEIDGEHIIFVKGAPDVLFQMTQLQDAKNGPEPFNEVYWQDQMQQYASKGQRILAAAYKKVDSTQTIIDHKDVTDGLSLVGLYGIIDPPKPAAIEAVRICNEAGVTVKMITGDHKDTAMAIGHQIGLKNANLAVTGSEIEAMSDDELRSVAEEYNIFARTTPEHKLRLVSVLQESGHVVGMTGDGVNDAPALKKADIGIAMGIKGTEVTKDASDMVLADDNFETIAVAISEGRRVYDNLKKTILFALPTALAQGLLIIVSILAGLELPLSPLQILWVNMVTTITLSFALGVEQLAPDAMKQAPRDIKHRILDNYAIWRIVFVSILISALAFAVEYILQQYGVSAAIIQTVVLQTIVMAQLFYMINCRELLLFSINKAILKNKVLWICSTVLIALQLLIIYAPFMHDIFGTASITANQFLISIVAGLIVFIVVEIEKFIHKKIVSQ